MKINKPLSEMKPSEWLEFVYSQGMVVDEPMKKKIVALLEAIENAGECLCWEGWHGPGWGMCAHLQRIMSAAESLKPPVK